MSGWLILYVVVMIWIILGFAFRVPELVRWMLYSTPPIEMSKWKRVGYAAKASITWPWFDLEKLKEKHNG